MVIKTVPTKRQIQILDFIRSQTKLKGYPPSVREIGAHIGLRSSSTVHNHLSTLEQKGYLRRDPSKPRALVLLHDTSDPDMAPKHDEMISLPILGEIAAGEPIFASERFAGTMDIPKAFVGSGECFVLTVKGDSMLEAGIMPGDSLVIRRQSTADNGDIVVALLDDEVTVKTFYHEGKVIRLQPANRHYKPIITQDLVILGKAVSLLRKF